MLTTAQSLMASCVSNSDIRLLTSVPSDWLDRPEKRQVQFILEYYADNGEMPDWDDVTKRFHLKDVPVKARPTYLFKELKNRYITAEITEKIPKALKALKFDPLESLDILRDTIASMVEADSQKKVMSVSDGAADRYRLYEERIGKGGITHVSTGVPAFDKTFYGYKATDLITIGGRPGVKKTWELIFLAVFLCAYLDSIKDDRPVLFISNEIPEEEVFERVDCILFGLPYGDFMEGSLTRAQRRTYQEGLKELEKKKSRLKVIHNVDTLDELDTYIKIYKPAAVFDDGSYLHESRMKFGWEKITYITQGLKKKAKDNRVPIINTTQLKRSGGKGMKHMSIDAQDDFAFSSSYTQDSDIAFRNYQDADMVFDDIIGSEVAKGRRIITGMRYLLKIDLENMTFDVKVEDSGLKVPVATDTSEEPGEMPGAKKVVW